VGRGRRTLTVIGKGDKTALIPLPPKVARAVDLAAGERLTGPVLVSRNGRRLDRHGAARIVRRVAKRAGIAKRISPHSLRQGFITAALDSGCRCGRCRSPLVTPIRGPRPVTIVPGITWTATPALSSPRSSLGPPDFGLTRSWEATRSSLFGRVAWHWHVSALAVRLGKVFVRRSSSLTASEGP